MADVKTLKIECNRNAVIFWLKGLSYKAVHSQHKLRAYLVKSDIVGAFEIYVGYKQFNTSAQIKKELLIVYLKELYVAVPFDKINLVGHYELTAEELMEEIKKTA